MNKHSLFFRAIAAPALCAAALLVQPAVEADEVYFDTVSTEKAVRMHGAYFGFFGGGSTDFSATNDEGELGGYSVNDEGGWFLGAEIGYEFRTPFPIRPAVEVELFYLANDFQAEDGAGNRATADLYHVNLMVNFVLALDFSNFESDLGVFAAFHPYIGAGIGASYSDLSHSRIDLAGGGKDDFGSGSDITFAYQLFGGLELALSDYVSIYGEYRRLFIDDLAGAALGDGEQNLWGFGFKVKY